MNIFNIIFYLIFAFMILGTITLLLFSFFRPYTFFIKKCNVNLYPYEKQVKRQILPTITFNEPKDIRNGYIKFTESELYKKIMSL